MATLKGLEDGKTEDCLKIYQR